MKKFNRAGGKSDRDAFLERIEIVSESGCWVWLGVLTEYGYGRFKPTGGKLVRAHRYAYEVFVGPIPAGMDVCHSCDVRCCVNPAHLWLGSRGDNNRDREAKGRGDQPHGSCHPRAKLTEDEAREIFSSPLPSRAAASVFGVLQKTVLNIRHRKNWTRATQNLGAAKLSSPRQREAG